MKRRIAIAPVAVLALAAAMARAQPAMPPGCAERVIIAMALAHKYGERRVVVVQLASGLTLDFWVNVATGTWTVVGGATGHDIQCLDASGTAAPPGAMPPADNDPT